MWSKTVLIEGGRKSAAEYFRKKLDETDFITYATEATGGTAFVMASAADEEMAENFAANLIADVLLYCYKSDFFDKELNVCDGGYEKIALLGSLLFLDENLERPLIKRETAHKVVSVDGIYNFRMQTMREGWRQLAGLVNNLVSVACDAGEIVKITAFIMSSTERPVNNLLVYSINGRPRIKNLTTHKEVSPVGLFADSESNLLLGIVRQGPVRINIQGKPLSDDVVKVLKGIATIKNSGV